MQAQTIDEVISFLEIIINDSKKDNSPLGYFAALYHKVTISVQQGIKDGIFEDGKRMEKMDVIFANRYLDAYTLYKEQKETSICWTIAFKESVHFWPIVLQHLLLGMNAHINLDLGIAAAQVAPGYKIHDFKNDFNKINEILSNLVNSVESDLSKVWPTLKFLLRLTKKLDSFLIDFSMKLARDGAWKFATELATVPLNSQKQLISIRDTIVSKKASLIIHPGYIASTLFKIIRLGEKGTISKRIAWLSQVN